MEYFTGTRISLAYISELSFSSTADSNTTTLTSTSHGLTSDAWMMSCSTCSTRCELFSLCVLFLLRTLQPHTLTLLGAILALLGYLAFTKCAFLCLSIKRTLLCFLQRRRIDRAESLDWRENYAFHLPHHQCPYLSKWCVTDSTCSSNSLHPGPFIRPHPAVWRIVFGMSVAYLMLLIFVLFQSYNDVKSMLCWLDPDNLNHTHLVEKV